MSDIEKHLAKQEYKSVIAAKENNALGDPRSESNESFVDYSENRNDDAEQ